MVDYDIKIREAGKITLYGTADNTIVVPSNVKFDTDRRKADIEVDSNAVVKVGIPDKAEKVELEAKNAEVVLKDLTFENLEMDCKGTMVIDVENISGSLEINLVGGEAVLKVPQGFAFRVVNKGRSTTVDCGVETDDGAENIVEFNGKDSSLKIVQK